jgi:hypothetical protein
MTSFMGGVGNLAFYQITRPHDTESHYVYTYLLVGAVSTLALRSVNSGHLIPRFFL